MKSQRIFFWHPFGMHGGERPEAIINRKKEEINNNKGWTLWSFQYRKPEYISLWMKNITGKKVYVFCICSSGTKNPKGKSDNAKYYQELLIENKTHSTTVKEIPKSICVPHPWKKNNKNQVGCAFKVKKISWVDDENIIEWINNQYEYLDKSGWQQKNKPTRGEWLLRIRKRDKGFNLGLVYAILELEKPYIVYIYKDTPKKEYLEKIVQMFGKKITVQIEDRK